MRKSVPLAPLFAEFNHWLSKRESAGVKTAKRYTQVAVHFCTHIAAATAAQASDIERWRASLDTVRGYDGTPKEAAASTINQRIAALRAFFQFCVERKIRRDNPMDTVTLKMVKVPERDARPFTREEIKLFYDLLFNAPESPLVVQDRALLEVLYGSGLRREEAANVKLKDFEGRKKLRIVGKGNHIRRTIVNAAEYRAVTQWSLLHLGDERAKQLATEINPEAAFEDLQRRLPDASLFYLTLGETVTQQPMATLADPGDGVARRCEDWFAKTGVKNGTAHRFRHSFATVLITGGASLWEAGKLLGHRDPRSTMIYTGFEQQLFEKLVGLHPRAE